MTADFVQALLWDAPVRGAIAPACALASAWLYRRGHRLDAARVGAAALVYAIGLGAAYAAFIGVVTQILNAQSTLVQPGITAVTVIDAGSAFLGNVLLVWAYAWPADPEPATHAEVP